MCDEDFSASELVLAEYKISLDADTASDRRLPDVYEFVMDDLATFTDRIAAMMPLARVAADLYEYACHKGDYG